MLQNAKQRGIPSSGFVLPVVTGGPGSAAVVVNNPGLILSTWEGEAGLHSAPGAPGVQNSRAAPGSRHMLTQLLVAGVNTGLFF